MLDVKTISICLGKFELHDISFEVERGSYFVLLGESGAGKSVLLEMIAGLQRPQSGSVWLNGQDITREKIQNRRMGLVYQDQALFPHLTVRQNIAYPLECRTLRSAEIQQRVETLAGSLGISNLLKRDTTTLSTGEAQKVALARSLATDPEILLLDEPLAAIDVQTKPELRALLRRINQSGQTIVHVTHDYEEAIALADRIAVIENNTITQSGTPDDIFHHPQSKFVAHFVGIKNFYKGRIDQTDPAAPVFETQGRRFYIAQGAKAGDAVLILRSEEITVMPTKTETSARNVFEGKIVDIEPGRGGIELAVDIGVRVYAMITRASLEQFTFKAGDRVWISFKATATQIIEE